METFSIKLHTKACKLTKNHRHFSLDLEEYFIVYHNIFTGCLQATASVSDIGKMYYLGKSSQQNLLTSSQKLQLSVELFQDFFSWISILLLCFIHRTEYKLERLDWVISKANISFIHTNKCLWMGDLLQ